MALHRRHLDRGRSRRGHHGVAKRNLRARYLTIDEHRQLLVDAGYEPVDVSVERIKGWLRAKGRRPL